MKKFIPYKNIRKRAMILGLPLSFFALQMISVIASLMLIIFSFSLFRNYHQWYPDQPGSGHQGLDRRFFRTVSGMCRSRHAAILSAIYVWNS